MIDGVEENEKGGKTKEGCQGLEANEKTRCEREKRIWIKIKNENKDEERNG